VAPLAPTAAMAPTALTVNHEIAPKEEALGINNSCDSCHFGDRIEWTELGWTGDPALGGTRP